ncbi:TetR/AcrR family transcriptional regulator [Synergistes jonesii]|uniref:TetR/AcrR family transcriptional regulator n=1 Tax=Synergistes jonesii TaxID=2754 RepID=UPI00242A9470|nr:TetR/AcrR family transcriptional regulator [Synergistes jonesii]
MVSKKSPRQIKAEKTKQTIFDCAIRLFQQYGYHSVSVDDIVEASKTSVGTFYHYFKCKEELIIMFLSTYTNKYYEDYERGKLVQEKDKPAMDRLYDFLLFSLDISDAGGEEFQRIAMAYILRADSARPAYEYMLSPERAFARICKKLIAEGQEKGEIRRDRSVEELFSTVALFSNGIDERWFMSRGSFDPRKEYGGVLWEFVCNMLTPR